MAEEKLETKTLSSETLAAETEETAGAVLKRARLAKKQDLRDIASYLCIRYQFLEALEEGRYKELPGEAYANGFIRSYAAYLGLDASDIITRYKREFFSDGTELGRTLNVSEEEAENMTPAPKLILFSLLLFLAAYGLWHVFSEKKEETAASAAPMESITVLDEAYPMPEEVKKELAETVPAESETSSEQVVPASAETEAVPPVPPAKPVFREEIETVPAMEVEPAQPAEPVVQEGRRPAAPVETVRIYGQKNYKPRIILAATEETWVEVTRGDTVVFSRLLNAGDRYQVSSFNPEELMLKTGNAGGLQVYVDGRLTQSLGPRGALRSNINLLPEYFAAKVVEQF